jgi:hypothetical protein
MDKNNITIEENKQYNLLARIEDDDNTLTTFMTMLLELEKIDR